MTEDSLQYGSTEITLKVIANKTGYSINTISRALKNKDDISIATRKSIQEVAKDMGYIVNNIAGALRSGTTKTIAIILGDISNPHFGILVKDMQITARKYGYDTIIVNTDENSDLEEQAIYSVLSKKVDGIIICPAQKNKDNILLLKKTGIPFILFGRRFDDIETDYVVCDDVKGGYLATSYLISKGHNRILFLNGPCYISSAKERYEGYMKALKESNLKFDHSLIREVSVKSGGARKILKRVLREGIDFTAIFAFSDMIAWESIFTLNELGINIPKSNSIIGFDNIQSRLFLPSQLTTISSSKERMSRRSVEILLKRLNGEVSTNCFKEILDVKLLEREPIIL